MGIENLNRWHWILVGLVAGLALGYVWTSAGNEPDVPRVAQDDFERKIVLKHPRTEEPLIRDVVIGPPIEARLLGDGTREVIQVVTFDELKDTRDRQSTAYVRRWLDAHVPYKPRRHVEAKPDMTIADYLAQVKAKNDFVTYRTGYEQIPWVSYAIWIGGCVLVIGGIWPTIINLLIRAGLAKKPVEKKEEYDLERFGKTPEPAIAQVQPGPKITAEDEDRLAEVTAKLEQELAGAGLSHTSGTAAQGGAADAPAVRQLSAGPIEPSNLVPVHDDEPKEYKGEFYPVVRPVHHKKED